MPILEGRGADAIAKICAAPRALVFVFVPWSVYAVHGRQLFCEAVEQLNRDCSSLDFLPFVLNVDEDDASAKWLAAIGLAVFASAGAGSLVWMASGDLVAHELTPFRVGISPIVARSRVTWNL